MSIAGPSFDKEQAAQTQALIDAMNRAAVETAKQFEVPMLNAMAGALVTLQGQMLASVPAGKTRKMLREAMERGLNKAIKQAESRPGHSLAEVITLGGKTQ